MKEVQTLQYDPLLLVKGMSEGDWSSDSNESTDDESNEKPRARLRTRRGMKIVKDTECRIKH
jgi:hypothetical protein